MIVAPGRGLDCFLVLLIWNKTEMIKTLIWRYDNQNNDTRQNKENATLSITWYNVECHYASCHLLYVSLFLVSLMLSDIMMRVILQSAVLLSVVQTFLHQKWWSLLNLASNDKTQHYIMQCCVCFMLHVILLYVSLFLVSLMLSGFMMRVILQSAVLLSFVQTFLHQKWWSLLNLANNDKTF